MASNELSKFNEKSLTKSQLDDLAHQISQGAKLSLLDISMIYGTVLGISADSRFAVVDGVLALAVEEAPAPNAINEIDRQIIAGEQSQDPAYRLHAQMLADCTSGDWLEQLIAEDKLEEEARKRHESDLVALHKELALCGELLFIEGLKCKNYDRNDSYWLFVGNYDDCYNAQQTLLHEHLIRATLKPNGATGCFKLRVDRLARGYIEVSDYMNAARVA